MAKKDFPKVIYVHVDGVDGDKFLAVNERGEDIPTDEDGSYIAIYERREIKKLRVKIHTGKEVTPSLIDSLKPDAIILATGAIPLPPPTATASFSLNSGPIVNPFPKGPKISRESFISF